MTRQQAIFALLATLGAAAVVVAAFARRLNGWRLWVQKELAAARDQEAALTRQLSTYQEEARVRAGSVDQLLVDKSNDIAALARQLTVARAEAAELARRMSALVEEVQGRALKVDKTVKAVTDELARLTDIVTHLNAATSGAATPAHLVADLDLLRRDLNATFNVMSRINAATISKPAHDLAPNHAMATDLPEIEIHRRLAGIMTAKSIVDVGAHKGDVSAAYLERGFRVVAVEANPDMAAKLRARFNGFEAFKLIEVAAGAIDGMGKLRLLRGVDGGGDVDTQLSSLVDHPLYDGLTVSNEIEVKIARLETLRSEGIIPRPLGVLKIDTEGHDLSVLQGAGEIDAEVICVEFWNRNFVFNGGRTDNDVEHYLDYFKMTPYRWHVELYRRDNESSIAIRVQTSGSLARSWGNAYFFREEGQFTAFVQACTDVLGTAALEVC